MSNTSNTTPLAIEAPSSEPTTSTNDPPPIILDVSGEAVPIKLDALGPMIINSDGTISRIQNWHELSELEQERTVRLLVKKRNLVRLKKLEDQGSDGEKLSALKGSE